jgi:hypothetical protein
MTQASERSNDHDERVSAAPATTQDVRVTGRRVLATIVDGVVLGILFVVMSALFGTSSAGGSNVNASLESFPALVFFLLAFAY